MGRDPYSKTALCCKHTGQASWKNYIETAYLDIVGCSLVKLNQILIQKIR